jgi:hypothetical protein
MGPPPIPLDPTLDPLRHGADLGLPPSAPLSSTVGDPALDLRASTLPDVSSWPQYGNHFSSINLPNFQSDPTQEVWSSLRVTGLPPNAVLPTPRRVSRPRPYGPDDKALQSVQKTPSEIGSQINGQTLSDSGYATKSVASGSIISSFPVNSTPRTHAMSSSRYPVQSYQPLLDHSFDSNQPQENDLQDDLGCVTPEEDQPLTCDVPDCTWTGKCPSDKK